MPVDVSEWRVGFIVAPTVNVEAICCSEDLVSNYVIGGLLNPQDKNMSQ